MDTEEEVQEPRIGVYVCHCGLNIAGTINCGEVAEFAATLPNVTIIAPYQPRACQ